ncbi:MAG: hypothetical protein RH942_19215 [Kiloniellaceae bacterium]
MNDELSKKPNEPSITEDLGKAIKREGRQIAGEAKTTARKMATSQRDALADYIAALAAAAVRGAEDLEASGYGRSAATVARAADDVDGFVNRLQAREPGDIWDDVEGFARDHPALLFGASFALAFGVTRFLKSSASHDGPRYSEVTAVHGNKVSSGGA